MKLDNEKIKKMIEDNNSDEDKKIEELKAENQNLSKRLAEIEERLNRLENGS